MPGSPLKSATRRAIGEGNQRRSADASNLRARAKSCGLSDYELGQLGRSVLAEIAESGVNENARVSACRALVEVGRAAVVDAKEAAQAAPDVATLSDEELAAIAAPEHVSQ